MKAGLLPAGRKRAIVSLTGTASRRVPDGLTAARIVEAKAGSRIGLTDQIKDFVAFADETQREFVLIVSKNAELSDDLLKLQDEGEVTILRFSPE